MDKVYCKECAYNNKLNVRDGECRLNPPKMDHNGYATWPLIRDYNSVSNFCYHGKRAVLNG